MIQRLPGKMGSADRQRNIAGRAVGWALSHGQFGLTEEFFPGACLRTCLMEPAGHSCQRCIRPGRADETYSEWNTVRPYARGYSYSGEIEKIDEVGVEPEIGIERYRLWRLTSSWV